MKGRHLLAALALAACCVFAGIQGIRATRDLEWPGDPDLSRDISIAERIRTGHPLSDAVYRGEWAWYNPLVPGTVAVVSALLNRPVHVVYARLGAYLNLLGPLSLFALLAALFDASVAVAATTAFLFLVQGNEPSWTSATYSPWLLSVNVVQAPFYITLLLMTRAWTRLTRSSFAVAGAALGVVLLGHTAPALILCVVVTVEAVRVFANASADNRAAVVKCFVALVASAALVGAPWLSSVVGHYHLVIRNPAPAAWVYPAVALSALPDLLRAAIMPSPVGVIAGIGLVYLYRSRRALPARTILLAEATTLGFFAYSYVVQYAGSLGVTIPALVPGFHFLFYLRAFEAMTFGIGVVWLGRWFAHHAARLVTSARRGSMEAAALAAVFVALAVAVGLTYNAYRLRPDFVAERANARRMFATPELRAMYQWIVTSTSRSDVFLAPHNLGLSVVGNAGRQVVALDAVFSNPFVNWEERARDQDEMMASLGRGDWTGFTTRARRYRVRYIAVDAPLAAEPALLHCCLNRAWSGGPWIIYQVL